MDMVNHFSIMPML